MIELNAEVKDRLAAAIDSGNVPTAAYVEPDGRPHISFYGSTHVHGADQLAIWVRHPDTSKLLQTLAEHPHMAFIYGDVAERVYYTFEGTARVAEDARQQVYDEMHPIERQYDPDMKGVPVIIDLDRFISLSAAAGKVVQERDSA
jgi:general stress protein 26